MTIDLTVKCLKEDAPSSFKFRYLYFLPYLGNNNNNNKIYLNCNIN